MTDWKRVFLTAAAIAAAVYFGVSYHPGGVEEGGVAPDFALSDRQGSTVQLSSFRGKYVLVHFWATWCGTCTHEMPQFNAMVAHFKASPDWVILGLSLDDSGRGTGWKAVELFEKHQPLAFTVLMDPKGATADAYGTYALPETYLIGREGQVIRKWAGEQAWDSPKMRAIIESEISKKTK